MKFLMGFIIVLNLFLVQAVIKQRTWIKLVGINYMVTTQYQLECVKDVVFNNRIPILERAIGLRPLLKGGETIDNTECDEFRDQLEKYEKDRLIYRRYFIMDGYSYEEKEPNIL